jgi:hypothetical protein
MIAVQKGFATPEQVVDALALQAKEFFSTGAHRLVGEILLDQGLIDREQLDEIIRYG